MRTFHKVLLNTLVANVTTSFLWFALTFWVYLETRSVMATAIIGGAYMLFITLFGIAFGTFVDRRRKKVVMVFSSVITLATYLAAGVVFAAVPSSKLVDWTDPWFWLFAVLILFGAVVENMRNIALSTTVTILVEADSRDRANGLVGTVQGVAFMVTSVFSGLAIGLLGMGWTLVIAIVLTALALTHLFTIRIAEDLAPHDPAVAGKRFDLAGSLASVRAVPGLLALILFSTFNNLVGGVFMALMDPYGLTLFSVETWGIVLGVTSFGFILGGVLVARTGLGPNPLRRLLLVNLAIGAIGMLFAVREWWWLYALGIFVFMCLMPMAEACEQTIIQRVVPLERQGRVFGFAQSVESASTPISSFLIGPIAQYAVIPHVNSPRGRAQFEWLLGSGEARGMALIFICAGLFTIILVLFALRTRTYRTLSAGYEAAPATAMAE